MQTSQIFWVARTRWWRSALPAVAAGASTSYLTLCAPHICLCDGHGPAETVPRAACAGQGPGRAEASLAAQCPPGAAPGDTTHDLTIRYDQCHCAAPSTASSAAAASCGAAQTLKPCSVALLQEQRAGSPSAATSAKAVALRSRAGTPALDSTSGLGQSTG